MVIDKSAKAATQIVDSFAGNVFGGKLEKAKLVTYKEYKDGQVSGELDTIEFFLNPTTLKTEHEAKVAATEGNQSTPEIKYAVTQPICLTIGELWFDTYDTRESVREKYIDKLEKLIHYEASTHVLPVVTFVWGQFTGTSARNPKYIFYVTKLSVEYVLFLPDATPVRAKVTLGLTQKDTPSSEDIQNSKQSPDHAKLYTVKRGDSLQSIATAEYEDPREWRRIAKTNGMDDPMDLRPGMKLLIPPILK